jgi:aminoglycoside N3'-acetyltransferase
MAAVRARTLPHTRADLAADFRAIGVAEGDIVRVTAALRVVGPVAGPRAPLVVGALLDAVGCGGTILGLSHTAVGPRGGDAPLFRPDSPCITGGLVASMLEWPGAVRSRHPTNSMVAIGPRAEEILAGHDEHSTCFGPMRRLVELDGKQLLIGLIVDGPGWSTVHLAQEELGLAWRTILGGCEGSYYEHERERRWFSKRDVPGCSMGFGNLYPLYDAAGVMRRGLIGDADSLLIACRDSYPIELDALRKNPRLPLCDDPACLSCRGTRYYNLRDWPKFYARRPRLLAGLLRARLTRSVRDRG